MSTERKDGGPAFPTEPNTQSGFYSHHGMSLRDWFAGQQMVRIGMGWPNHENMRQIAENCYEMADAMLEARKP